MNITKTIVIVAAILAALLAAWIFPRRTAVEPVADARQAVPDDPDGLVLKQLVANGSDLSKPHNLEFLLDFPDQARAAQACDTLQSEGYTGAVKPAGGQSDKWQCMATKRLVPSHAAVTEISRRMEDLAKTQGGSYNGWGTLVVQ